ncbi:pectinesterase family protein [Novosphingobium resinovorum]|uniref:pectinesterase family protein n=1 Tax=Novosphingobium TaxID=165696 RepID=UPI001B3C575D|nr:MULTISPECIES: pectinesterase family protein [Novosphingobium]MBF7014206.1 pectin esterase [Novosphingobium sp. HR1a]WJM25319.1 pectinesterase family protein [Novosphingobium resinovorum]
MNHRLICAALVAPAMLSAPAMARTVHVDPAKAEAFHTVQSAIDSVAAEGGKVLIAPGTYREKLTVSAANVTLAGTGRRPDDVVLVYGDSAMTAGGTFKSATLSVTGASFTLRNLTVSNDWWLDPAHAPSQAVAVSLTGDAAVVSNVRMLGHQDTLFVNDGQGGKETRAYFEKCYIAGHVDFVFGNAKAFFRKCQLHGEAHESVMYTAQSRNAPDEDSAFVFEDCRLTADAAARNVSLGRPWRDYASVIFLEPTIDVLLVPGGFTEWTPGKTNKLPTTRYAVYSPRGRGAKDFSLIKEGQTLNLNLIERWRLKAFFKGDIGWIGARVGK